MNRFEKAGLVFLLVPIISFLWILVNPKPIDIYNYKILEIMTTITIPFGFILFVFGDKK